MACHGVERGGGGAIVFAPVDAERPFFKDFFALSVMALLTGVVHQLMLAGQHGFADVGRDKGESSGAVILP